MKAPDVCMLGATSQEADATGVNEARSKLQPCLASLRFSYYEMVRPKLGLQRSFIQRFLCNVVSTRGSMPPLVRSADREDRHTHDKIVTLTTYIAYKTFMCCKSSHSCIERYHISSRTCNYRKFNPSLHRYIASSSVSGRRLEVSRAKSCVEMAHRESPNQSSNQSGGRPVKALTLPADTAYKR